MKHNEMDTEKSNSIIAEFMGWKKHPIHKDCSINKNKDRVLPYWVQYNMEIPNDEFGYHKSWDWLIPVVEKIWKYIGNRESLFYFDNEDDCRIFTSVDRVNNKKDCYKAVVEFINWYNENK